MRYSDATAFRQALEHRLKARANGGGAGLARDRKRVAFDRLLARLLSVAPRQWLLKGGFALDLRLVDRARATKDIDIDWQADGDTLVEALIDAGETLTTTDLLTFAGIPPVEVRALQLEYQVAEKVHAYTRVYAGNQPSSRAKDLVDIALIAKLEHLDGQRLHDAITTTFNYRNTHAVPSTIPTPPSEWTVPYRQLAGAVGIPPQLAAGHRAAAALLDPILGGRATGTWDPVRRRWTVEPSN